MAVVSPSSEEEQRDDDQRLPPSFPRPHHLVSPQRFSAPPSVSLLFAAEYRSCVRREANDRLLLSPLSPSACTRTTTIKFREPTVDLVVSPSSSAYSAEEEPSSLADWAELQSDSISEEEDLISADDLMDDDRTAQTSPAAHTDHQDRSKPFFEGASMDVSYHEDRNANLTDEPDKTTIKRDGDHDRHKRNEIEVLDFGSEVVSTTDGTSGENTGRGSSTGNETGESRSDGENEVEGESAPDSAVDSARSVVDEVIDEAIVADDGGEGDDSAEHGNVADDSTTAEMQLEEITDREADGNEVKEDTIDNGSNDGDKTTDEIEEGNTRSQKGDGDAASIEDGAAASPASSKRGSVARVSIDSGRRESAASQKNEAYSIKSNETAGRSPPAQLPPVSLRQTAVIGYPFGSDGEHAPENGEDGNDHNVTEGTAEQPVDEGAGCETEEVDLESSIKNEGVERADEEIEELDNAGEDEKANETQEQPAEENEASFGGAMEPIGNDASNHHQQQEEAEEGDRRPSMVNLDDADAAVPTLPADGDDGDAGDSIGENGRPHVDESTQQQEIPDEFVLVNNDALSAAAVEEDVGGSEPQEMVVPIPAEQQRSPAKKISPKKLPQVRGPTPNCKPPSGRKSASMKKSQSMASGPPKSASRPPTSLPLSPKKPPQRPKSQEPPSGRRAESSPARQTSRPKTATNELDPEKQAEKEARRADAEAAFQSWLERKRSERRRARSSGRQEDVDVTISEEAKQAKKAEAEAAFQAWLDRKRSAQRKDKMGLLSRQIGGGEQSSDTQRHDDPFEAWKREKADQRRAERRLERARQRELDSTIVPLGSRSSPSSIPSLSGVVGRAKRDSLPRLNGRSNVRMISAKLRSRSTANVGRPARELPVLSAQSARKFSSTLM